MAREAKLRCPNCGTQVTVFEDEVGESGHCPGCGSDMEVFRQDFGTGKRDSAKGGGKKSLAARVANLVGRATDRTPTPPEDGDEDEPVPEVEASDGDILSDLIEADSEGMAAAEEALQGIDEPVEEDEPVAANAEDQPVVAEAEEDEEPVEEEPAAAPDLPPGKPVPADVEYRIWQGLAEEAGDHAMAARLELWLEAEKAGCSMTLELPGGVRVPLPQIVLAEAAAAQARDQDETGWRDGWTRRLLKMAAEWPDEDTIEGVVTVLNLTDGVVEDLKASGVWPWAIDEDAS